MVCAISPSKPIRVLYVVLMMALAAALLIWFLGFCLLQYLASVHVDRMMMFSLPLAVLRVAHAVGPYLVALLLLAGYTDYRRNRSYGRLAICVVLAAAIAAAYPLWTVANRIGIERFNRGLETLPEKTALLTNALERYRAEHGAYPASLDALVPAYLDAFPRTDFMGYPPFRYKRAEENSPFKTYELSFWNDFVGDYAQFVYWPEGGYPEHLYVGKVNRIGGWARMET